MSKKISILGKICADGRTEIDIPVSPAASEDDEDQSKRSKFNGKGKAHGLSSFASKDEGKARKERYAKQRLNERGSFAGHFFFSKHMKNATMTGAPDLELALMKVLNNWISG
ncbi:hypothetical protein D5086_004474 [Populus alba]|uniref:Uncharacterized protein n=1 Tax=Populus alba TaxID=43335 RepID=A0ACC4CQM5_POPAL